MRNCCPQNPSPRSASGNLYKAMSPYWRKRERQKKKRRETEKEKGRDREN